MLAELTRHCSKVLPGCLVTELRPLLQSFRDTENPKYRCSQVPQDDELVDFSKHQGVTYIHLIESLTSYCDLVIAMDGNDPACSKGLRCVPLYIRPKCTEQELGNARPQTPVPLTLSPRMAASPESSAARGYVVAPSAASQPVASDRMVSAATDDVKGALSQALDMVQWITAEHPELRGMASRAAKRQA